MEKTVKFNSQLRQILPLLNQDEIKVFRNMRVNAATKKSSPAKVSIITPTNKTVYIKNIFSNYSIQQYPNKELIIILNNNALQLEQWLDFSKKYHGISVYQLDEALTTGECLNYGIQKANGSIIARFDDDDYYGPNYLTDMIGCFRKTSAAVLGKSSHFVYFENSKQLAIWNSGTGCRYVRYLPGGTFIIKREVFGRIKFRHCSNDEDDYFCEDCRKAGLKLYAADPFNFIQIRRTDKLFHTWTMDDQELLGYCQQLIQTNNPIPYVMV